MPGGSQDGTYGRRATRVQHGKGELPGVQGDDGFIAATAERDELLENITTKLRTLFPDGADDAEEKRAEVLAYAAEETLGRPGVRDVAAAAELSFAGPEKLWRGVGRIADAHGHA